MHACTSNALHCNYLENHYWPTGQTLGRPAVYIYISSIMTSDEILTTVRTIISCTWQQANLKCKVDTGAQGNVRYLRTLKKLCPSLINAQGLLKSSSEIQAKPYVKLTVCNGTVIKLYGVIKLSLKRMGANDQQWTSAEFIIDETPGPIIIGFRTNQAMKFITVHCDAHDIKTGNDYKVKCERIKDMKHLMSQYPDRFKGIGKFPGQYLFIYLFKNFSKRIYKVSFLDKCNILCERTDNEASGSTEALAVTLPVSH